MRFDYDEKSRGLMIHLVEDAGYRDSEEVTEGIVVDFDDTGRAVRIELEDVASIADKLMQVLKRNA